MIIQHHQHFRKLVGGGYRWIVVRIWWSQAIGKGGYCVFAQSTEKAEALQAAKKWLTGGAVVIRDRITGQRYSVAEFEQLATT